MLRRTYAFFVISELHSLTYNFPVLLNKYGTISIDIHHFPAKKLNTLQVPKKKNVVFIPDKLAIVERYHSLLYVLRIQPSVKRNLIHMLKNKGIV